MDYVWLLLLIGAVLALCIFVNRITDKLKIPSLLLFIGLGMAFGALFRLAGLGNFTDYSLGSVVCSVCLVFVIFYGGFGTNFHEAKPVAGRAVLLSMAGTALTAGLLGAFVYLFSRFLPFFSGFGWAESMLVGSVLSSTDAASVFNILRSRRLNLRYGTSSLLEMESGSNDPMSYMLTVLFAGILATGEISAGEIAVSVFAQIGFGVLFGALFGAGGAFVLKKFSFNMGQGGTIFLVALALIAYALPSVFPGMFAGNGYLAVYIAGLVIGNARIPQKRDGVRFFDALTGVAQMMIFFLLGLLATPEWLVRPQVLLPALLVFAALTLVARPVAVTALLAPFRARPNQIFLVSWAGLRGVASVVFAAFAIAKIGEENLPFDLFSIVFVVVILSMLVQGSLLPMLSGRVGMLGSGDDVLRTFNDYTDETDVSFVKIVVGENHPWSGRQLCECVMPREFLVVLILRGEEVIVPDGKTRIGAGDVLVTAAPAFENRENFGMYEEYVGEGHPWSGMYVRELSLPKGTLIAMIKRKGGTVIPYGATQINEGDSLVCVRIAPARDAEGPAEDADA